MLVAFRLPVLATSGTASRIRFLAGLRLLWRDRACRWFVLALTILGITIEGNFVTFGLMWIERGGSDATLGMAWSVAALGEIPLFYWGTRLLARVRPLTLLGGAALLACVRWLIILLVADWRVLLVAQPLHALMYVCYLWGAVHFIDERSRAAVKNTGQALFAAIAYGIANIAGNWLAGHLYQHAGTATVYAVFAALTILAAGLFAVARRAEGASR
ncbi:MAG TPA: MFS transporter, partial [bacterium]|nr:MFS transporter [bacterium]